MITRLIIQSFEKELNSETVKTKQRLTDILEKEIADIKKTISNMPHHKSEQKSELHRIFSELLVKKALAEFEAEEIVKKRMDMKISFYALICSSIAILISIASFFAK